MTRSSPKHIFSVVPESASISGGTVIRIIGSYFTPEAFVKLDGVAMKTAHAGSNELWFITLPKSTPQNSRITVCDRGWAKDLDFLFTEDVDKIKIKSLEAKIEKLEMSTKAHFTTTQAIELSAKVISHDTKSLDRLVNTENYVSRPPTHMNSGKLISISELTNPQSIRPMADDSFPILPPVHHFSIPPFQMQIPSPSPYLQPNLFPRKRSSEDEYASDLLTKMAKQ